VDSKNQIPSILYRAFTTIDYARDFIEQGLFRMGSPGRYKNIEDQKRRDITEGTGHIKTPGDVDVITLNDQVRSRRFLLNLAL
jgi:hypothetical protein